MPELKLNNVTLHYEVEGSGPPLLMIAGFMSDGASWAPLVPLLDTQFTLIRVDNRTAGRTKPWDAPVSMDIWARDALAVLDHLQYRQAHVLGHSLGGRIGWVMAQLAPERVASLSLAASVPPRSLTPNVALFRALIAVRRSNAPPDTWLNALFPWLFSPEFYDMPGAVEGAVAQSLAYPHAQSADAMEHQLNALAEADHALFTRPPDVPTQALLAEKDLLDPLSTAETALRGLPQHVIAGAGHSVHWDAPEAVAQAVARFTAKHPIE